MVFTIKGPHFSYELWTEITLPATEKTYLVESIVHLIIFKTEESCITNTKNVRKFNFDSTAADAD